MGKIKIFKYDPAIKKYSTLTKNKNDLVILLTNNYDKTLPDLTNMSFKEVITILDYLNIDYTYEGYGYLSSIEQIDNKYKLIFKPKY